MIGIDNLSFEFVAHSEPFVYQMYARWDEFCRDVIEPIIDEVLSDFDEKTVERSIERLDLKIENVREESFFEDFQIRFREELIRVTRIEFAAKFGIREKGKLHGTQIEQIERRLQNVTHYLSFGTCEGQWADGGFQLQTELVNILDYDERGIVWLVQESFGRRKSLERMMLHLDGKMFLRVLSIWTESAIMQQDEKRQVISLFAKEYPYLFLLLLERVCQGGGNIIGLIELPDWNGLDYSNIALSSRQTNILQNIIKQLPDGVCPKWCTEMRTFCNVDENQMSKIVLEDGKYQYLLDESIRSAEKRCRIMEFIRDTPSGLLELVSTLSAQQSSHLIEIMDEGLVMELMDVLNEQKETLGNTKCGMIVCDWVLAYMDAYVNNLKSLPMDRITRFNQDNLGGVPEQVVPEDVMFASGCVTVGNAGLVLLTPWFPRLFAMLGLLDEGGKDFKDVESRKRAVFVMQRMVSLEEREYAMSDLMFNRILVHLPFSEVLPNHVELTNEEIEAVDSMLEGVKGNWSLMAATSVKGVQHSFVERKGVLEMQEERMLLTVEPRSYDLLLDSLPWGYKLVRFPWLEKRIHVNWRDKE